MNKIVRELGLGLVAVAMVCGAAMAQTPAAPAAEVDEKLEISPKIRERIAGLRTLDTPAAPLKSVKGVLTMGAGQSQSELTIARRENGVVAYVFVTRGAKGGSIRRVISLLGIIELASYSENGAEIDTSSTVNATVPGMFLSVPYKASLNISSTGILIATDLSGDLDGLVSPAPGTILSIQRAWQAQVATTSVSSVVGTRNRKFDGVITWKGSCKFDKAMPASALHAQLRGDYLPVECEGAQDGNPSKYFAKTSVRYAYLVESQFYVLLSSTSGLGTVTHAITAVEYLAP